MSTEAPEVTDIRMVAIKQAIRLLQSAGAEYAIQYAGATHGTLPVMPPKPPRRRSSANTYPRGTTRAYYLPLISGMQPGDSCTVPAADFDIAVLTSNISSYCNTEWGNRNTVTRKDRDNHCVHVLRLVPET